MFQISAYTISLSDSPEMGRTKINYLFSGGTSPFFIWSGVTNNSKYISILKQDEYGSNSIGQLSGLKSAYTNYNLIFNGSQNSINQFKATAEESGSYNLASGIKNVFFGGYSGNTTVGSGNTNFLSFNCFIHGINNETSSTVNFNSINSAILSSYNSNIEGCFLSSVFSAKNSNLLSNYSSNTKRFSGNTLVGINNMMESSNNYTLNNLFILNGKNNFIQLNNSYNYDFVGILNGESNYVDITSDKNNNYIFGSNITSESKDSSYFENLYIDESLLFRNIKKYTCFSPTENITIDTDYSFHEINSTGSSNINVLIPNPKNDLQVLSILFNGTGGIVSFVEDFSPTEPTNIACKKGFFDRFKTNIGLNPNVGYFFIWTKEVNKWVMFTSNTEKTANF